MLLTPEQIKQHKRLDKRPQEVWQVVVRKLRVWSASSVGADDGADAIPCRPFCILVNNLYPLGQVVSKKICDPPEQYPSAKTVLELTLRSMVDPPAGTPQHRPDKIVFPDKDYVGQLRKSFDAIGIECSYLSESEGIDAYIQYAAVLLSSMLWRWWTHICRDRELSGHLVRNDLASVAEVSERPGMLSGAGVTPELLREYYAACARYASLDPWNHLAERQAIQVDAVGDDELRIDKRHHVGRGTIFTSVISTKATDAHIRGLALFFTRADLERRVLPPGEKLALLENPALRRCACCDKKAAPEKELKRCTRCKSVFYCDATCQRGHWKDHKVSCMPQDTAVAAAMADAKIKWGVKEISVLYGAMTSVPFDDLDAIDKHGLEVATVRGETMYPSAVVFRKGDPDVPDATELTWLVRALHAQIELLDKHPRFMHETMVELLGLEDDGVEDHQRKLELQSSTFGHDDYLVVRNSTVLTMDDVERLRQAVIRREGGGNDADESGEQERQQSAEKDAVSSDGSEEDAGREHEEGQTCRVM